MIAEEIARVAAGVMYFDDVSEIDFKRSLFNDYSMSSLDFVDFAFELKDNSGKEFSPDELWPINLMMKNPDFYTNGEWTDIGKEALSKIFSDFTPFDGANLSAERLHEFFSVNFIQHRLANI